MNKLELNYNDIILWALRDRTCTRVAAAAELSNLLMKTSFPDSIIKISDRRKKIIEVVYNYEKQDLNYEPGVLKVLLTEVYCDDKNNVNGIMKILFPDNVWMKRVYGSNSIIAHIRHFINII